MNARWADLESARREHYRARTASETLAGSLTEHAEKLAAIEAELIRALADRKQFDEALMRQREDSSSMVRQVGAWRSAAIDFCRSLERAIESATGKLSSDVINGFEKIVGDFSRCVSPLDLQLIRPSVGEAFDDRLHRADGMEESEQVAAGHVLRCVSWGFRHPGGTEHARVVLASRATINSISAPAARSMAEAQQQSEEASASPVADPKTATNQ